MSKILFLVQAEQKANLDRLYEGITSACDCDLRRLSSSEQKDLRSYFKGIDVDAYDYIMLMLRSKKVMKQTRFLKTLPKLVFLEHDACQNYIEHSKYKGKFLKLYKALPGCTVIASGATVAQKLRQEGISCHFVPKGYDHKLLFNSRSERDIECAFVGSIKNSIYKDRVKFLEELENTGKVRLLKTDPGYDYFKTLNRIRFFISADIGLGEYMLKNFEAMACGCIVFAFDQGKVENLALGFKDMSNIVLYHSQKELFEKMEQLCFDDALAERISRSGQLLAESRYNFELLGKEVVKKMGWRREEHASESKRNGSL